MATKRVSRILGKALPRAATNPNPEADIAVFDPSSFPTPSLSIATLSSSPASPATFARFLRSRIGDPSALTPALLLCLLRGRLRHHPRLAHYDLRIFTWAASLDGFRHDHHSYEFMARSLSSSGRLDALLLLLAELRRRPCPCSDPGIFSCPRTEPIHRLAVSALCRASRLDDALSVSRDLKRSVDGKPDASTYNILINSFSKHGKHDTAVEVFETMMRDRVRPDVVTFNSLIASCCRRADLDAAQVWFHEMRGRGVEPNVVTFNSLITGFFRGRRFKEGIGVAREMLELGFGLSAATCEILMNGLCREGRPEEACAIFMRFLGKGSLPEGFDCFVLVDCLCAVGKADRALELVNVLWEEKNFPSNVVCSALIEGLRVAERIDDACGVMERMIGKGMVPDMTTFNCLLEALCDMQRTGDANWFRILASGAGLEPDDLTFGILVRGFTREGKTREGEDMVDEMLDAGFIQNIASYNRLMEGLKNRLSFTKGQNS